MAISYMSSAYPPGWDKQQLEKLLAEARAKETGYRSCEDSCCFQDIRPKGCWIKAGLKTGGVIRKLDKKKDLMGLTKGHQQSGQVFMEWLLPQFLHLLLLRT
jgi:hypothetical protein